MIDSQQIVDGIRSLLSLPESQRPEHEVREYARDYSDACRRANARLLRCNQLLGRQLIAEAIHQSEIWPNLVKEVGILQFPQRESWLDYTESLSNVDSPPDIQSGLAGDLNEAYVIHQSLEKYLRRHRLLAIGRAPIEERTKTLRALARVESRITLWRDDLAEYEKERHGQLAADAQSAWSEKNLPRLIQLQAEVEDPGWVVPVEAGFRKEIASWISALTVEQKFAEMQEIEQQLNAARDRKDVTEARKLRAEWNERNALVQLPSHHELAQLAAIPLSWLDDVEEQEKRQKAYNQDVANFQSALDKNLSDQELLKLYNRLAAYGEVPRDLQTQYDRKLAGRARAKRMKGLGIAAAVGLLVVVGGAAVAYGWWYSGYQSQVARHETRIKKMMTDARYSDADAYLKKLADDEPSVREDARIVALAVEIDSLLNSEQARQQRFREAMDRAQAAGVEAPDLAALDLARAEAATDAEKSEVQKLESEIQLAAAAQQAQADKDFTADAEDLADEFSDLDKLTDPAELTTQLAAAESKLRGLKSRKGDVSSKLHGLLDDIETVQTSLNQKIADWKEQQTLLTAVKGASGSPATFSAALQRYSEAFPTTRLATEFKTAASEEDLWDGLSQWSSIARQCSSVDPAAITPAVARTLLGNIDQVAKLHPNYPQQDQLETFRLQLSAIAARKDVSGNDLLGSLSGATGLFKSSLVRGLYMIQTHPPVKRYYLRENPVAKAGQFEFSYLLSADASRKFRVGENDAFYHGAAAQSILAEKVLARLQDISDAKWEQTMYYIVDDVMTEPNLDPVLRMLMLKRVLETAVNGSYVFRQAYRKHLDYLNASEVDLSVNFLDPDDTAAKSARTLADLTLRGMPDRVEAAKTLVASLKDLKQPRADQYRWSGWLHNDGGWKVNYEGEATDQGTLAVVRQIAGNPQIVTIGRVENGAVKLVSSDALVSGRPVFLRPAGTM